MSKEKFHVGWFLDGFRAPAWNRAWSGHSTRDWPTGQFYMDMARDLERGCFDYFMLEDSNYIPDIYGGSMDVYLKYGRRAPKHDPAALAGIISQVTTRLGIIATIATTESTPFQVARLMSTLDHISSGRIGWNVVTGSNDRAAQNFGRDAQPEHDQRYEMADEFVAAVRALWDSWKEDAVIMDEVSGVYVDASKVNTADYNGTYFRTRGPLNTVPSPQHHPVLVQAGVSSRGQKFSAENADSIIAVAKDFASMRTLRENIRRHAAAVGRNPDHIKVLFLAEPVLGETDDEARAKVKRMQDERARALDWSLETAASVTTVDFSQYDPDQPLPKDLTTNGHQGILNDMVSSGKTLRELAAAENNVGDFVGTPETVAGIMEEIAQEIGGDGFLLTTPRVTRRYVTEIVDGLIPALQKRGVVRTHYEHELLRDNLTAF
jgi:FMN-dependent oxidoreductase (nitrilotriacetate monooxygenase family)